MEKYFVNREKEIKEFMSFVQTKSPNDILFFHSEIKSQTRTGSGKSAILRKFLDLKPENAIKPIFWSKGIIDFYYLENRSETGLFRAIIYQIIGVIGGNDGIQEIIEKLSEYENSRKTIIGLQAQVAFRREIQESFISWLQNILSQLGSRKLLLFFDSFEYVEQIGSVIDSLAWLIGNLQDNIKFVIAGRNLIPWEKNFSILPNHAQISFINIALGGLDVKSTGDLLNLLNVSNSSEKNIGIIHSITNGNPNLIAFIAMLHLQGFLDIHNFESLTDAEFIDFLAPNLINYKDDKTVRILLILAHTGRRIQLKTLRSLMDQNIDNGGILEWLSKQPYITYYSVKDEYGLDNEIQDFFNFHVWPIIDPQKTIRLVISNRLIDSYRAMGITKDNLLESNEISNYIYHQTIISQEDGYKFFKKLFQKSREMREYSTCHALLRELEKFSLEEDKLDELALLKAEVDLQEYRIETAETVFNKLKEKFRQRNDQYNLAQCLEGAGDCNAARGHLQNAINNLLEGVTIYQRLTLTNQVVWITVRLGEIYSTVGKYNTAEEYLTRVEYLSKLNKSPNLLDKRILARTYAALGFVYRRQGKLNEALPKFEESLKIKQEIGENWDLGISLVGIGNVWRDYTARGIERFSKAVEYYKEACDSCSFSKDLLGLVRALEDWGWLEVLLIKISRNDGKYDEANLHIEEATRLANESLNLCDKYAFSWDYAANYHTLLHVAIAKGDKGGEEKYANLLFEYARKWSDGFMLFDAMMHLATIAERNNDYKEVQNLSALMKSYINQGYQFPYFMGLMLKIDGDLELRRNNLDSAFDYYGQWLENMIQQPTGSAGLHTFTEEVNELGRIFSKLPPEEKNNRFNTIMNYWRKIGMDSRNEFHLLLKLGKDVLQNK